MTILPINHIVSTPDVRNDAPRIKGTGVKVANIAAYALIHNWSVEKIAEEFELTPAQIHAALAYYYDHQAEIDAAVKASNELVEQIGTPFSELRRRIEARMPPKDK